MAEAPLAPGTRLGPYEIEGTIGAGGMGQVYRARDPRLARHVAIKTLSISGAADPDARRRFETEAKAAGTRPPQSSDRLRRRPRSRRLVHRLGTA